MKHSPEQRAEKRYPDHTRKELEILSMVPDAVYEAGVSIGIRRSVCATTIREEVEPLELKVQEQADELAKLRALAQVLVDACHGGTDLETQTAHQERTLAIAKEAGFTPTNTDDHGTV